MATKTPGINGHGPVTDVRPWAFGGSQNESKQKYFLTDIADERSNGPRAGLWD